LLQKMPFAEKSALKVGKGLMQPTAIRLMIRSGQQQGRLKK